MALTTCSASYSSIPSPTWSYDVFVSFSGKDTRFNFTDHLFAALYRSGIRAFRDDKKLERGKDIWTELEKAIEMSRIAVIVFSRNYTASGWCLDELVKIMECKRSLQQIVLPIFYDVTPSEVWPNLSDVEDFGEDKLQRWRALTEAANLAGWDLQNPANRSESKCIEEIIEDILIKLYNLRKSEFEGNWFLGNVRDRALQSLEEPGEYHPGLDQAHTESEQRMRKAENRPLHHKLENEQRALQDTREDAAIQSKMSLSQIAPIQSKMPFSKIKSVSSTAPIQSNMSLSQIAGIQPKMSLSQITGIQPRMSQPKMSLSQITGIQPKMSLSQIAPIQSKRLM
ncbi:disease resistance protein RPV1-like [Fagus crenata]